VIRDNPGRFPQFELPALSAAIVPGVVMILVEDHADISTPTGMMRTFMFRPAAPGSRPGVVLWSEIYQMTGPIARTARLLAGHGYIVAVPEIYHDFEPLGSPFEYDKEGTDKGNRYKTEKTIASYDGDARAALDHLAAQPDCNGRLGTLGICIGGHLSFRCAMNSDVQAAACFYATDIHKRSLGKGMNDNSIDRVGEISGELMMIWGRQDRHVDQAGRKLIYNLLVEAGTHFSWHEFNARHAFVRDEGYRYNPALAGISMDMVFELFHRRLQMGEPFDQTGTGGPSTC
jgi:carboxymethylenebutenolidase